MDHLSLVPLARGLTPFEAKVLTARLGADGFIWQVRGSMDSVYPVGMIEVLVPAAELDDARALVGGGPEGYDDESAAYFGLGPEPERGRGRLSWLGTVAIAAAVVFFFVRLLAFG